MKDRQTYYVLTWDLNNVQRHENTTFDEMDEKYPDALYIATEPTIKTLKEELNKFKEL